MKKEKNITTTSGEIAESSVNRPVKEVPLGILRLDLSKPRRLSVEFKSNQKETVSPQPSVTFAEDSLKSDSSKANLNLGPSRMHQLQQQQSLQYQQDKVQFPEESLDDNESDEEDYSASVNAIIQRRASTRRSKKQSRRASSPFTPETPGPERRRSSVFTTSSGDTAITVDDNPNNDVTQDEIFENIKLHKEVLSNVKMQPWNMRKKLKLVLQAKAYIKKHEGQLQERLAQSHSTKDMLARWNIVLIKKWQKWKRELTNMSMWFIPWELKIKEIESHFGSVVASYFIFLRWLFWVNIVIAVVIISFVTIPEIITADPEAVKDRKFVLPEEKYNSTNFLTLWDFEGVFKYSPLFYGWYTNRDYNDSAILNSYDRKSTSGRGYRLPFAYFITGLVVYAYSFFATLRKMAENSRMSKLSEKDDECIFSWKVFTAWDYMIGNAETAHNRVASIVMGFKEALLEEAEKKRESRNWKVICIRVLVNTLVAGLLSCSVVAVVIVVKRSMEPEANSTVWRRNEITVVITLITLFFPMLFEVLGLVEQYHPRKQLRLQLARIMVLNLLNLYSLIFALFDKVEEMTGLLKTFRSNLSKVPQTDTFIYTTPLIFDTGTTQSYEESTNIHCFCNDSLILNQNTVISLDMIYNMAQNLSVLVQPTLKGIATVLYHENLTGSTLSSDWLTGSQETFQNTSDNFINSSLFSSDLTTSSLDNFTYYYENFSIYWDDNTTDYLNYSVLNYSDYLAKFDFNDAFSINSLKDIFVDYLTYILSPFIYFNTTDFENMTTSDNFTSSFDMENSTVSLNFSSTDYEYFKSTVLPLFNYTLPQEEQRFETELTTMFDEVSTTIATWPDIISTGISKYSSTKFDETINSSENLFCLTYCKTLFEFKSKSTLASNTASAISTVSYEEAEYRNIFNYTMNAKLRSLCWETMFGQELLKLTLLDLIMSGLSILFMDFFRGIFVRFMNRCWCWDLEKKFPQYGDFKVAENILHLVNNQGMVWMGMFFSPGLVVLNVVKLYIMMYLRAWAVLTCNVPHEIIFRASRSNNFYYALLLMMLFLCVLPVGYAIVWIEPSWHCGPFSGYPRIFHIFTNTIRANVPDYMHKPLDYIASPGIVIPLLLLLVLIIYYLVSLTGALREANNDLKTQLRRERTEERRKMFQLADRRRRGGSGESNDQTPFSKWKKLIGTLPSTRSCDEPRQESEDIAQSPKDENDQEEEKVENKGKVFFTKLIKKALGKSSTSEDEQDATDTEQHDSLPYDNHKDGEQEKKSLKTSHSGLNLELNTLQSIVSRLRKNSHKEEKDLRQKLPENENENSTKKVDPSEKESVQKSENKKLEHEATVFKKKIERTKKLSNREEIENIKEKQGTDQRKTESNKQLKLSDIDKSKVHSSKLSPRSREYAESQSSKKERPGTHKKSTAFKEDYEQEKPLRHFIEKQKHHRTSKPDPGNDFLKRILEANKVGTFNKDDKVISEKEPKASTSYDGKHKRAREKDYSKIVRSKPKKPIIEIDEDAVEDEELDHSSSGRITKNSTSGNAYTEKSKKPAIRQDSSSSIWSDKIPMITISKTYSDENILTKEQSDTKYKENTSNADEENRRKLEKFRDRDNTQSRNFRRKFVFNDCDDSDEDYDIDKDDDKNGDKRLLEKKDNDLPAMQENTTFKPKIRCVLRKQVTAIDEDVIIHFGENLAKAEAENKMIKSLRDEDIDGNRTLQQEGYDKSPFSADLASGTKYSTEDQFLTPNLEAATSKSEDGIASDRSTSDDTELKEDSIDTVLNSPYYLPEDNDNSDIIDTTEPEEARDSIDSPTDQEMETDVNDSIEYDTEFTSEDNEENLKVVQDEDDEVTQRNIPQLQRPSLRSSSSRSQTESSCCYKE